mgnify:FL=1
MYTIQITTKEILTERKKNILAQIMQEVDDEGECKITDQTYQLSGSSTELEKLSYLLGIVVGSNSSFEMKKFFVSFER